MSVTKKNNHPYGDNQKDIQSVLIDYSKANEYPIQHFSNAICSCGNKTFKLFSDENEGAAVRECIKCKTEHPIGDSEEYLESAKLEQHECLCESEEFEITAGISLYKDSDDVRWFYIGCRYPKCKLIGCYCDWKNEYLGYKELLDKI